MIPKPLQDPDGSFSWRKAGTGLCFLLFAFIVIGYCITHNFNELPSSYLVIIGMVFTFYFAKQPLSKLEFTKSGSKFENSKSSNQ